MSLLVLQAQTLQRKMIAQSLFLLSDKLQLPLCKLSPGSPGFTFKDCFRAEQDYANSIHVGLTTLPRSTDPSICFIQLFEEEIQGNFMTS